uniref:Phospholipase A2 receptor 1 n=1 Tax=Neolamprologus brichardi TaxID=32507 RepID=A0A3Q4HY65_NEOBR
MECLVPFLLNTTTNGTLSVLLRGVRTIFCGAQPPLATIKAKDGASVQCKVNQTHRRTSARKEDKSSQAVVVACSCYLCHFTFVLISFHFCVHVTKVGSWAESSQECHSYGANLTSIHSLSEVEMLVNLLANCKECYVWIGLWKQDTMKWTNGRPVSYTNWSPVEPKNPLNVSCRKYLKFTLLTARTASIFLIYGL